ncbi:MAG: galactokinase [Acidobacteriaceae bacterium]|nr:galactokinase [Acidobacteriaceae bacterium]MBV9297002.1 galactokinase [Acidobacteriaceae bacterium]MBV9763226.1 galactokinase [Acidobacteriaceae bacterium]
MAIVPDEILSAFQNRFHSDRQPDIYRAPGRVNLIGEHTDYNLGFVFPIALDMACHIAIAPADHGKLRMYAHDLGEDFEIAVADISTAKPTSTWSDYTIGVAQQLSSRGFTLASSDLYIASDVPAGSGLSSSAALEVASAFSLLGSGKLEPLEIAKLGQRAEIEFVGVPCGIMDQYASVFGREGAAIQLDCRSLKHEYVPLPGTASIIAVNSMVKHELGTSAYRERVNECQQAVNAIKAADKAVESLRDVSLTFFEQIQDSIPAVPRRRARHVISENQRVLDFAAAAKAADLPEMGRLFVASHRSMQYDYEISCEEIDFLVDTAIKLPGVYGSRMTGGGFGGCTVNLVSPDAVDAFHKSLGHAYEKRFGKRAAFYDCKAAPGAGRLSNSFPKGA